MKYNRKKSTVWLLIGYLNGYNSLMIHSVIVPFVLCFQVQMAERASEVTELKRNLAQALRDKEQLQEVKRQTRCYLNMMAAGISCA